MFLSPGEFVYLKLNDGRKISLSKSGLANTDHSWLPYCDSCKTWHVETCMNMLPGIAPIFNPPFLNSLYHVEPRLTRKRKAMIATAIGGVIEDHLEDVAVDIFTKSGVCMVNIDVVGMDLKRGDLVFWKVNVDNAFQSMAEWAEGSRIEVTKFNPDRPCFGNPIHGKDI